MSESSADRNILFGIIALEMDFIDRDQLIAAMNEWVVDKSQRLDDLLTRQGALTEKRRKVLEALVQEHLEYHENDSGKSLAAVSSKDAAGIRLRDLPAERLRFNDATP